MVSHNVLSLIKNKTIVVIGDVMVDHSFESVPADMRHHQVHGAREDVYEVTDPAGESIALGGAAKLAAGIAVLGSRAICLGVIGVDERAETLKRLARDAGIDFHPIVDSGRPTTLKLRIILQSRPNRDVPNRDVMYRVDHESTEPIASDIEDQLVSKLQGVAADASAFVIADFQKGVISAKVVRAIAETAGQRPIIVDGKYDWGKYTGHNLVAMIGSLDEFREGGLAIDRRMNLSPAPSKAEISLALSRWPGIASWAITCPTEGVYAWHRDETRHWAAPVFMIAAVEASAHPWTAVGAGAAFTAAFSVAFAGSRQFDLAVRVAASAVHAHAALRPGEYLNSEQLRTYPLLAAVPDGTVLSADEGEDIEYLASLPSQREVRVLTGGVAVCENSEYLVDVIRRFLDSTEFALLIVASPGSGKSTMVQAVLDKLSATHQLADASALVRAGAFPDAIERFVGSAQQILVLDEFLAVEPELRVSTSKLYEGVLQFSSSRLTLNARKIIAVGSAPELASVSEDIKSRFNSVKWLSNPTTTAEVIDAFAARLFLHTGHSMVEVHKLVLMAVCAASRHHYRSRRYIDKLALQLARVATGGRLGAAAWNEAGLDERFVSRDVFGEADYVCVRQTAVNL